MIHCPECGQETEPTEGDKEYAKVCLLPTYKDYPVNSMEYYYRKKAYDNFHDGLKVTKMLFAKKEGKGKPIKFVRYNRCEGKQ